jgi:GNAT superfamily N-acetyltransferase
VSIRVRLATSADIPTLQLLIEVSVRELQAGDYTAAQIEGALATVFGVDTQLIADGTYFVVESAPAGGSMGDTASSTHGLTTDAAIDDGTGPSISSRTGAAMIGCGGWSKRSTLFGGDHWSRREDTLLDPTRDAAKIRAFFVHPAWTRRGVGSAILAACESAAGGAGFSRLEMGATLTGVPLYRARGYVELGRLDVPLVNGEVLPIVRMGKALPIPTG